MASHGRVMVVAGVLVAIAAACGISAVGEGPIVGQVVDGDAGSSTSSGGSSGVSSTSGSGGVANDGGDAAPPDAASDAPADGTASCPTVCNGGCDGGCIINGGTNPVCPDGVARCEVNCTAQSHCDTVKCGDAGVCRITCNGANVCDADELSCGTSACTIRCIGLDACNSTNFDTVNAAALCVHCNGTPGCNSVLCSGVLSCKKELLGSGNNIGGCGPCGDGICP